jgi:hypothetical protein
VPKVEKMANKTLPPNSKYISLRLDSRALSPYFLFFIFHSSFFILHFSFSFRPQAASPRIMKIYKELYFIF